jgi:mannitol/fructose-specific phosphotransferase system IIA component
MRVIYGVFQNDKLIKKTSDKSDAIEYIKKQKTPDLYVAKKYIQGEREWQQSHWMFYSNIKNFLKE